MNKNLLIIATLSLASTTPIYGNIFNYVRDNKAALSLIGFAVLGHNVKDKLKDQVRALPAAQQENILSIGEPTVNLVLAFGVHQFITRNRDQSGFSRSWNNLSNIANRDHRASIDPIATIFTDGGKIFTTAGAAYTVGKYAFTKWRG